MAAAVSTSEVLLRLSRCSGSEDCLGSRVLEFRILGFRVSMYRVLGHIIVYLYMNHDGDILANLLQPGCTLDKRESGSFTAFGPVQSFI